MKLIKKTIIRPIGLFFGLFVLIQTAMGQQTNKSGDYAIIPYPEKLVPVEGKFDITRKTTISVSSLQFKNEQKFLNAMLANFLGGSLAVKMTPSKANTIIIKYDKSIKASEGYRLTVNTKQIVLTARNPAGMFYAIETLRQMLPDAVEKGKGIALSLKAVNISDQPRFEWRGMMLDVSRHFFSLAYLRKYVDMMALYKMNKLHLHLSDDQGWRIEIKKYPRLTELSSQRTYNKHDSALVKLEQETGNPDYKIDPKHQTVDKNGTISYGGFYTQQEMKSFIKYAQERHVEVIPEIDMPGHMLAAAKAYSFITCDSTLGDGRGFSNPICPCNPQVVEFAKDIYAEIADLFPSKYLHIGGDEVEKRNWAKSAECQALLKQMGSTNLNEIQNHFTRQMKDFLSSKGKILVGWDEISEAGLDSNAVVMFWRSWEPGIPKHATANNNKVVLSPCGPLYFDFVPDLNSLNEVYHYDPLSAAYEIPQTKTQNIIGVQGNLWTEFIPTEERADYMIMPRMTALSEVGWTYKQGYSSYLERLSHQYKRLDDLNVNYRMPDIEGLVEQNAFVGEKSYFKQSPLNYFKIRYTVDGSLPNAKSPMMDKPVKINRDLNLNIALFNPAGRRGDVSKLNFQGQQYRVDQKVTNIKNGLNCSLYIGNFSLTAEMKAKPDSVFFVSKIEIPQAVATTTFGLKFNGYIEVPQTGIYSFYLNSDDGSVLLLDGEKVVDNDGLHPPKEKGAEIALVRGLHVLDLNFINGAGGSVLELKYSLGNSKPIKVPENWLKSDK